MSLALCILVIGAIAVFIVINVGSNRQAMNHAKEHRSFQPKESPNEVNNWDITNMTVDEKIGQMVIAGVSGTVIDMQMKSLIHDYKIGGVIFYANNLENPKQSIQLVNQLKSENQKNSIPLFLSVDQEGGMVSRLPGLQTLPENMAIGKKNDLAYSYNIGKLLGRQVHAFGMNLNFAPVLDINSNPNNPVIGNRSFGNKSSVVSDLGIKAMKGMQSEKIISVVKHFPGHGDTDVDSHLQLPKVNKDLQELNELELVPFKHAIKQGADAVMVAHILLPKLDPQHPSSMSDVIISDLLRKQLRYDGVVITDDMTMQAITDHYEIGEAAVKSVQAGCDVVLVGHEYENIISVIKALKTAVQQGVITEQRLDESIKRILRVKQNYKLNDDEVNMVDVNQLNRLIEKIN